MNYSTAYYDYTEQKWKDDKEGFIEFHEAEIYFYTNHWRMNPVMTKEEADKIVEHHKKILKEIE